MNLVTPEIGLLFWQTVSFMIVLFVLSKYAWKPIMSSLKEREDGIENALLEAKRAKEEMAALKSDNERLLNEARGERDKMLKEARDMKDSIIAEAKGKAQAEANKIMTSAREAINNEKMAAIANPL